MITAICPHFHAPSAGEAGGVLEAMTALPPREDASMNAISLSVILRIAAVVVFILATLGVAPVPMTPLGLALWCGSTVHAFSHRVGGTR